MEHRDSALGPDVVRYYLTTWSRDRFSLRAAAEKQSSELVRVSVQGSRRPRGI
jgi:hypothetical protein